MTKVKFKNGLNEKGIAHLAEELEKVLPLPTEVLNAWVEDANARIFETASSHFEIGSYYTKSKNPHVVDFSEDHFDYEIEEVDEEDLTPSMEVLEK